MLSESAVQKWEREWQLCKQQSEAERKALRKAVLYASQVEEAQTHVQAVAQKIQQEAHEQISQVVTRCLEAVFDEPYQFKVMFERKRGRTEARLVFIRHRNGVELEVDPCDGAGGGVVDVASFALRIACLVLQKPRRRRVLILDEPFKFVSERNDYRERVRDLLLTLSKEMHIQFIMVTHDPILQVGKIITLG